jgi:ankyrin repeat protein
LGEVGITPLIAAISKWHNGIAKMLLDNGANPDMPDLNGTIPLLLAKKLNNLIGHDMLLSAGATPV